MWKPLADAQSEVVVPRFQFLCDLLEKQEVAFLGESGPGREGTSQNKTTRAGVSLGWTGAESWPFKLEGEDPEVDGRGKGLWYIKGPSRAGSPICHFLSLNRSLASQIPSVFLTDSIPPAGPPPQGNDGRRVHSHCRHRCGAGFRRQVSGTMESLRHWPVHGEGVVDGGSPGGTEA